MDVKYLNRPFGVPVEDSVGVANERDDANLRAFNDPAWLSGHRAILAITRRSRLSTVATALG